MFEEAFPQRTQRRLSPIAGRRTRQFSSFRERSSRGISLMGLKDKEGREVIPARYRRVQPLINPALDREYFLVQTESEAYNVIDTSLTPVFNPDRPLILANFKQKLLVVDSLGVSTRLTEFNGALVDDLSLAAFGNLITRSTDRGVHLVGTDQMNGLIDDKGNVLLPVDRQRISLRDSVITINPEPGNDSPARILDYNLKQLYVAPADQRVWDANANYITLKHRENISDLATIVGYGGRVLAGPVKIINSTVGFYIFEDAQTELRGILDKSGKVVLSADFLSVSVTSDSPVAIVTDTLGKTALVNYHTGEQLTKGGYYTGGSFLAFQGKNSRRVFQLEGQGKIWLYDSQGRNLLREPVEGKVRSLSNGTVVALARRGQWFFYDFLGERRLSDQTFSAAYYRYSLQADLLSQRFPLSPPAQFYATTTNGEVYAVTQEKSIVAVPARERLKQKNSIVNSFRNFIAKEKERTKSLADIDFEPSMSTPLLVKDSEGLQEIRLSFNRGIADRAGNTIIPARFGSVRVLPAGPNPTDTVYFLVMDDQHRYNVVNSLLEPSFAEDQGYIGGFGYYRLVVTDRDKETSVVTDYRGRPVDVSRETFAEVRKVLALPSGSYGLQFDKRADAIIDSTGSFVLPAAQHQLTNVGDYIKVEGKPNTKTLSRLLDENLRTLWSGQARIEKVFPNSLVVKDFTSQQLVLLSFSGDTLWSVPNAAISFYYRDGADTTGGLLSPQLFGYRLSSGKTGLVNQLGKEIVPPHYQLATSIPGLIHATDDRGQTALLNFTGEAVIDWAYQDISYYKHQNYGRKTVHSIIISNRAGKLYLYDSSGKALFDKPADRLIRHPDRLDVIGVSFGKKYYAYSLTKQRVVNDKAFAFLTYSDLDLKRKLDRDTFHRLYYRVTFTAYSKRGEVSYVTKDGRILGLDELLTTRF